MDAVYELLDVAVTLFTHANLALPAGLDRVLRYVVVTPDLHRVHHSTWRPETDGNFGAFFPVWDLQLGTYRATPRDQHETMALGLDDVRGTAAHRIGWLLASVLRRELGDRPPSVRAARDAMT